MASQMCLILVLPFEGFRTCWTHFQTLGFMLKHFKTYMEFLTTPATRTQHRCFKSEVIHIYMSSQIASIPSIYSFNIYIDSPKQLSLTLSPQYCEIHYSGEQKGENILSHLTFELIIIIRHNNMNNFTICLLVSVINTLGLATLSAEICATNRLRSLSLCPYSLFA